MARKFKALDAVEKMKQKAVRFVRDVLGDPELSAEIQAESPESYAARKRITILDNPVPAIHKRRIAMANTGATKADLEKTLDDIEDVANEALDPELSREELVAKVKEIADLTSSEEEEEGEEDGINGGAIIDHTPPRERRLVAVQK